jgi:hypothetical protein
VTLQFGSGPPGRPLAGAQLKAELSWAGLFVCLTAKLKSEVVLRGMHASTCTGTGVELPLVLATGFSQLFEGCFSFYLKWVHFPAATSAAVSCAIASVAQGQAYIKC